MATAPVILGRYALHGEIASGGMATVHVGRVIGAVGFSRTVAIKRLHPQLAKDRAFVEMFVDEARLAARIHHPNVVSTLDVVVLEGELFVVMEYVEGESLSALHRAVKRAAGRIPLRTAVAIGAGMLEGLHAAHEATGERGEPLGIVHRDVSPQNVLVGVDGVARLIDFGVAKAVDRLTTTREGQLKGKLAYMANEQLEHGMVDRRTDVYAASAVLWEAIAGRRLFQANTEAQLVTMVLRGATEPPSMHAKDIPAALDEVVMRGLAKDPEKRWANARDMAVALEAAVPPASARDVGGWVRNAAAETLRVRAAKVVEVTTGGSAPAVVADAAPRSASDPPAAQAVPITVGTPRDAIEPRDPTTSMSATGPSLELRPRKTRSRAVIYGGGAAAVVAVAAVAVALSRGGHGAPGTAASGSSSAAFGPVDPPPSATASALPAPPAPAPAPDPPTSAAAAPSVATTASPSSRPAPRQPVAKPSGLSCNPPYTVDAKGVHTFKRECLGAKP